ncbi:hypothetical protein ABPG72_019307 [Tetrahymena utriculariae]
MGLIAKFKEILQIVPVWIYNLFISRVLTVVTHSYLADYLKKEEQKKEVSLDTILDIGIGTGLPLYKIASKFPQNAKILGVDIDENYVKAAQKLFKDKKNVEIRLQNFYELDVKKEGQFDIVLFSFSFMLMPEREKAIILAKQLVKKDGRIIFLLTLHQKKNPLFEKMKPLIKYLTTIDFGNITYESEFDDLLKNCNMEVNKKVRVTSAFNPFLNLFKIFMVDCKA